MRTFDNRLSFAPFCPRCWQGYSFTIGYRGRRIRLVVTQQKVRLFLTEGSPLSVWLYEKEQLLSDELSTPLSSRSSRLTAHLGR